ncbi:hypothetical protein RJ55_05531 [Drechmeria coniospora]|nr:hypothetical protein RJ55_05531 [Drechmeria coniospora]
MVLLQVSPAHACAAFRRASDHETSEQAAATGCRRRGWHGSSPAPAPTIRHGAQARRVDGWLVVAALADRRRNRTRTLHATRTEEGAGGSAAHPEQHRSSDDAHSYFGNDR